MILTKFGKSQCLCGLQAFLILTNFNVFSRILTEKWCKNGVKHEYFSKNGVKMVYENLCGVQQKLNK